jgi:hypothetical protein
MQGILVSNIALIFVFQFTLISNGPLPTPTNVGNIGTTKTSTSGTATATTPSSAAMDVAYLSSIRVTVASVLMLLFF